MISRQLTICVALILGVLVAEEHRADACSAGLFEHMTVLSYPADGALAVPTNGRLVMMWGGQGPLFPTEIQTIVLRDPVGASIPLDIVIDEDRSGVVYATPTQPLAPNTRYEVELLTFTCPKPWQNGDCIWSDEFAVLSDFETGDAEDQQAPSMANSIGSQGYHYNTCIDGCSCDSQWAAVEGDFSFTPGQDAEGSILRYHLYIDGELAPYNSYLEQPRGLVATYCWGDSFEGHVRSEIDWKVNAEYSVRAVDWAGNLSEPSGPLVLDPVDCSELDQQQPGYEPPDAGMGEDNPPTNRGGGCNVAPTSGWFFFFLTTLLLWRIRGPQFKGD